jgi:hypothetical protein
VLAGRAAATCPCGQRIDFWGWIMGIGFNGLSKACLAVSLCLAAALPVHAQSTDRYVHVVSSDGAPIRLTQSGAGHCALRPGSRGIVADARTTPELVTWR